MWEGLAHCGRCYSLAGGLCCVRKQAEPGGASGSEQHPSVAVASVPALSSYPGFSWWWTVTGTLKYSPSQVSVYQQQKANWDSTDRWRSFILLIIQSHTMLKCLDSSSHYVCAIDCPSDYRLLYNWLLMTFIHSRITKNTGIIYCVEILWSPQCYKAMGFFVLFCLPFYSQGHCCMYSLLLNKAWLNGTYLYMCNAHMQVYS